VPNDVVPGDAKEKLKKHHAGANRIKPPGWSVPPFGEGGEFDSPPVTREHGRWMRRLLLLPALRTAVRDNVMPGDVKVFFITPKRATSMFFFFHYAEASHIKPPGRSVSPFGEGGELYSPPVTPELHAGSTAAGCGFVYWAHLFALPLPLQPQRATPAPRGTCAL
jgi:hypothetical protein